uniref:Uncharacterized protein n=1 Tax=Arundo donax TaxID=35708 RepID=A0A0A8Z6F7_ARUDO
MIIGISSNPKEISMLNYSGK